MSSVVALCVYAQGRAAPVTYGLRVTVQADPRESERILHAFAAKELVELRRTFDCTEQSAMEQFAAAVRKCVYEQFPSDESDGYARDVSVYIPGETVLFAVHYANEQVAFLRGQWDLTQHGPAARNLLRLDYLATRRGMHMPMQEDTKRKLLNLTVQVVTQGVVFDRMQPLRIA